MARRWRIAGWVAFGSSAGLIIGFTAANVGPGDGAWTATGTAFVGLLPVLLFFAVPTGGSRIFEIVMVALLVAYTASWIYATFDYKHYMLGGLYFVFLPLYGVVGLGFPIGVYWIVRTGRLWLRTNAGDPGPTFR